MSAETIARRLPAHVVRAIAVEAQVDPRTVNRVLAGKATRAATRERIEKALKVLQDK
jgi:DNA-binding LacI/PurR family transcriptional regulator